MTPRQMTDAALVEALIAAARAGGDVAGLRAEALARMARQPGASYPVHNPPVRL